MFNLKEKKSVIKKILDEPKKRQERREKES